MRYRFDVSYDGTRYAGWQIQPNGETIQAALEEAVRRVAGERVRVYCCGRTDQGVHARQHVCHADLGRVGDVATLRKGLNAVLAADIRVLAVRPACPTFDARRSVVSKEYRYFIWNGDVVPPFLRLYRAHIRKPLDVAAMRRVALCLEGRHDFAAFSANPNREVGSTVRDLRTLRVSVRGPEIAIVAVCEGFLYRMVRSLAGFLVRAGEGIETPDSARAILASRARTARVPTAPPEGLFLWKVRY